MKIKSDFGVQGFRHIQSLMQIYMNRWRNRLKNLHQLLVLRTQKCFYGKKPWKEWRSINNCIACRAKRHLSYWQKEPARQSWADKISDDKHQTSGGLMGMSSQYRRPCVMGSGGEWLFGECHLNLFCSVIKIIYFK